MKILHVSDIHYREAPETWVLLKEAARQFEEMRPDLILITGDLTNDGLDEQFLRVKRFVSWLDFCPVLIIPGNRDLAKTIVPVPAERSDLEYFLLTHPEPASVFDEMDELEDVNHGRQGKFYDHFPSPEFFYRANGVAAVGLNSTPEITARQIEVMTQHFNKGQTGELRIFCAHHSFLPVPTKKLRPGDVVPRSADILQTLIELNVDLLFCGHIHRSHVWELSDGRHRLLCCNAGSLLDTSGKKDNGFLEIEIKENLRITKHSLFSRRTELLYQRLHFGTVLQDRQRTPASLTALSDLSDALSDHTDDGGSRTKKKTKNKK
ncbi:MAG: metallophosphoesterase [Ktedonobacteraceae bacterium]|nr:metallophosphoesterase [Ktedonobacteraceae bacterium]